MQRPAILFLLIGGIACGAALEAPVAHHHPEGATIAQRFDPPAGFTRLNDVAGSFGRWLQGRPLKPAGSPVHLYDGRDKSRQDVHAAVLDLSVGERDLQQCADAVMRLRAEYLFATGRQDRIAFHFTNGFLAEWSRWRNGERIEVKGETCKWRRAAEPDGSHDELLRFMTLVFTYAGTLSLAAELDEQTPPDLGAADLRAGDVFIHGGSPGHAVIMVDAARDPAGRTAFLLAQSYMPAQEVHVLNNLEDTAMSPWFVLEAGDRLRTPEWTFDWGERRRFADDQ